MSRYPAGKEPECPVCHTNKVYRRESHQCQACALGWNKTTAPLKPPEKIEPPPPPILEPPVPLPGPPSSAPRPVVRDYDEAWDALKALIGETASRYPGPAEGTPGVWQKIVIASDFHFPFSDDATIAALFQQNRDADLFIANGDLTDSFAISRFIKYEMVAFERELAALIAFLEQASATWPKVILVEGNHDRQRFEKQLRTRLDDHMVDVIQFLAGGNFSVLRAVASRYPNITVASMPVGRYAIDWMLPIGDAVALHAEKFSKVPGSALRQIEDWLLDQEVNLHLAPWRVVIQAHTHGLSWFPFHADKLLVESGCCADLQGYQLTAKIGGRPQRNGWVTLEQKNGTTDRDSVRCHWPEREEQAA